MIKVEVTQEDIDNGPKWVEAKMCPVAMALKRTFGDTRIVVAPTYFCFYDENQAMVEGYHGGYHQLPKEVTKFISDYDCHMEVKPFTFEIDDLIDMTFAKVD